MKTTTCIIYSRTATKLAGESNYAIAAQIKDCKNIAKARGYKVLGIFQDEGVSGNCPDRPALDSVFELCAKKHTTFLIMTAVSVLARDAKLYFDLKRLLLECGTQLMFVRQPEVQLNPYIEKLQASLGQTYHQLHSLQAKLAYQIKKERITMYGKH